MHKWQQKTLPGALKFTLVGWDWWAQRGILMWDISFLLILYWGIITILLIDDIPSFELDWNLLPISANSSLWGHNLCPIDCCLHLRPSCPTNSWFNKAIALGYLEHIPLEPSPSNRLAIQSAFQALRIYWPLFGGKSKTHLQVDVLCQSWSLPVPTQEGSEARNSPWFGVCSHFYLSIFIKPNPYSVSALFPYSHCLRIWRLSFNLFEIQRVPLGNPADWEQCCLVGSFTRSWMCKQFHVQTCVRSQRSSLRVNVIWA